jgi:TonB family protein
MTSSLAGFIASYAINSVWEVALIAGAGWLVSRILNRLGPQAEHVTWVLTLALALVTPALPLFRSVAHLLYLPTELSAYSSIIHVSAHGTASTSKGVYVFPAVFVVFLSLLYLGSVLYFGLRLGWSLHRTARLLRESVPAALTPDEAQIWSRCTQSFFLAPAHILSSSQIAGPVTLGFRQPVLVLPVDFAAVCSPQDFLAALAHECAHIKRHDFQKNLFYEMATLIIAFHPATWIVKGNIAKTREMICDAMATENLIDSRRYIASLLRLASTICNGPRAKPLHAIGIFDANILEKRIMMMKVTKRQMSTAAKLGLTIPGVLLLSTVAMGAAAMAVVISPPANSESVAQTMPDGPIYRVGNGVTPPELIKSTDPVFPKSARHQNEKFEGICVIRLVVDSSGMPRDVHVIRALGPDFDANAIAAVQQYRFKPAMRSGEPVAVTVAVEVNYRKY